MQDGNVALFIAATDAFNRIGGDVKNFDEKALGEWVGFMDPEIRFEPQQAALQGAYEGRQGAVQWLTDLAEHYESGEVKYDEIHDHGNQVLGLGAIHFVGRGSGIATHVPAAILMTFRGGLITRLRDFAGDKTRALAAAGQSR